MVRFHPMLRSHELTEQQWRVMRAISAAEKKMRPVELSEITFLSMPSLSRIFKTLESRALIQRSRHHTDMRSAEFGLAPEGRSMMMKIAPHSAQIYAEIESLVGGPEIEQLYATLDRLQLQLAQNPPVQ